MKAFTIIPILLLLLLIPSINALEAVPDWETTCTNSTHIFKKADIYLNNILYDSNSTLRCPYGCDQKRDVCWKWPGDALPGEYYMLFEIVALGMLFLGLWRIDDNKEDVKTFDVVIPILSAILFFTLALQGNNVIDIATGESVIITMVVWFNYGMGAFSLMWFFVSLLKFVAKEVT